MVLPPSRSCTETLPPSRSCTRMHMSLPEASPHKRRLKCDTNISPRRLMTHSLHQMVHHRTTLCGSEQRSATIARITTHTLTTILNIKRGSSESCAIRDLRRVTLIYRQGWVHDGTLLDVLGNEVWVFLCKKNGVNTNILSKSNHTHGGGITEYNAQGNSRIRLRFSFAES